MKIVQFVCKLSRCEEGPLSILATEAKPGGQPTGSSTLILSCDSARDAARQLSLADMALSVGHLTATADGSGLWI